MSLFSKAKTLLMIIPREGVLRGLAKIAGRAKVRFQEWRLGIHTEAVIVPSELGILNPESNEYSATKYEIFTEMLQRAEINPREHVFFDFGAGMGRAMILAATYPFREVHGVEVSEELVAIAKQNIQRCRHKLRCPTLEIVVGDATSCAIPVNASLFYFYNPFFGATLSRVLRNIKNSLEANPRHVLLVCNLPERSAFEQEIRTHDWLGIEKDDVVHKGTRCLILTNRHSPSEKKDATSLH